MTKEELLQKGLSEETADEIIAAFEDKQTPENSLQLLEKALSDVSGDEPDETLEKAKKDDEDNDDKGDDEYNESYMKKHMPRYMKENKKSCGKMAKEVGLYSDEMKKAIDELKSNSEAEGAVIEMADLKPFLEKQTEMIDSMAKAIEKLSSQVEFITSQNDQTFDVMKKAATVTLEQSKSIEEFLGQPTGKKGKTAVPAEKMEKAGITLEPGANQEIYTKLLKATKDGDRMAGQVISVFESAGKNINALNSEQKGYVAELLKKEAH